MAAFNAEFTPPARALSRTGKTALTKSGPASWKINRDTTRVAPVPPQPAPFYQSVDFSPCSDAAACRLA
jgi:hypothetical protein